MPTNRLLPEGAIQFEGALRTTRGMIARGTQLYTARVVHQLVNGWLPPMTPAPHLVIVLFDADGEPNRKGDLDSALKNSRVPYVLAMSVQEFEAWLIADPDALKKASCAINLSKGPEDLQPGEAKQLISGVITTGRPRDLRCTLARIADLDVVARRCPSFDVFRREVAAVPVPDSRA